MKVLKPGFWHDDWTLELVCPHCEVTLQIDESDVKPTHYTNGKFECTCIDCCKPINIIPDLIHPRIIKKLEPSRKCSSSSGWD